MRARRPHAERVPVIEHAHALGAERYGEMKHLGPILAALVRRAGDEQIPHRGRATEALDGAHPIATRDALCPPDAVHPIAGPGADEHELRACHFAQERFSGLSVPILPDRRRDQVRMHREGQRYAIAARASAAPGPGGKPLNLRIEVRQVMSGPPVDP